MVGGLLPKKLNLSEPPYKEEIVQCIEYGRKIITIQPEIEIVNGFSQCASCATLWIQEGIIKPKKIILLSSFALKKWLHQVHLIPSLHIYGENDTLLKNNFPDNNFKEYSLCPYYKEP